MLRRGISRLAGLAKRQICDKYVGGIQRDACCDVGRSHAPWFMVPADYKRMVRTFIAGVITSAITGLKLSYPKVPAEQIKALMEAKKKSEEES